MAKQLPDIETLRNLLDYNSDTGSLTWKPRQPNTGWNKYFNDRFAGTTAMNASGAGGVGGTILGKKYRANRIAWKLHYGEDPQRRVIHKNGSPTDLRIENLTMPKPEPEPKPKPTPEDFKDPNEAKRAKLTKHPLSAATLKKLIRYDKTHGVFYWAQRPTIFFAPTSRPAKENADRWNATYAGRQAPRCGRINLFGKQYSAAQIAWTIHYGRPPSKRITHKNGDKTDARIENLRIA
jgi:hypothetical protein